MDQATKNFLMNTPPGLILDLSQTAGGWCLLKIRNAMKLAQGQVVQIMLDDQDCRRDLPAIMANSDCLWLVVEESPGRWRLYLSREANKRSPFRGS